MGLLWQVFVARTVEVQQVLVERKLMVPANKVRLVLVLAPRVGRLLVLALPER
jgi:hypothetical protein